MLSRRSITRPYKAVMLGIPHGVSESSHGIVHQMSLINTIEIQKILIPVSFLGWELVTDSINNLTKNVMVWTSCRNF